MASVHKRKHSPFWYMKFRDLTKNKVVFLKTPISYGDKGSKEKALEFARTHYNASGGQYRTREQISQKLNELCILSGANVKESPLLGTWLERWLEEVKSTRAYKTYRSYLKTIKLFKEPMQSELGRSLDFFTRDKAHEFFKFLQNPKHKISNSTINQHLRNIQGCFTDAKDYMPINPFHGIKHLQEEKIKRVPFTEQEVFKLLEFSKGAYRSFIMLGAYTGARIADCAQMRWEGLDFKNQSITFKMKKKRGKEYTIAMHDSLKNYLLSLPNRPSEGFVCESMAGLDSEGRSGLSSQFKYFMERAGMDFKAVESASGKKFSTKTFHSFRHYVATTMQHKGIPQEIRMMQVGHDDKSVHSGYSHAKHQTLLKAVNDSLPHFDFKWRNPFTEDKASPEPKKKFRIKINRKK